MSYSIEGMSLRAYCRKYNLKYFSIWHRMTEKNESPEEAVKNVRTIPLYNGKTKARICREANISYQLCRKLMQRGMSLEEAVTVLKDRKTMQ